MPKLLLVVVLTAFSVQGTLISDVTCGAGRLDTVNGAHVDHVLASSSAGCEASADWSSFGQRLAGGVFLEAEADYGSVRLYGHQYWHHLGVDDRGVPAWHPSTRTVELRGAASFEDSLTILSAPNNAVLVAVVSGSTFNFSHQSDARIRLGSVEMGWNNTKWALSEFIVVPYTVGAPVSLMGLVEASATDHSGYGANAYVNLDLSLLLLDGWDGIFDANEQEVTNFSFQTRSGASYGLSATTVPEPRSFALFSVALAGIVGVSCKSLRRA